MPDRFQTPGDRTDRHGVFRRGPEGLETVFFLLAVFQQSEGPARPSVPCSA
jgi:hypothetical protein